MLATQKPTVDVITGLIKSNLPARIAFQVASRTDCRVVLDEMGAEQAAGQRRHALLVPGTSHSSAPQGTYVSDDEINTDPPVPRTLPGRVQPRSWSSFRSAAVPAVRTAGAPQGARRAVRAGRSRSSSAKAAASCSLLAACAWASATAGPPG